MSNLRTYLDIVENANKSDMILSEDDHREKLKEAMDHLMAALMIFDSFRGVYRNEADAIYLILDDLNYQFPPATGIK